LISARVGFRAAAGVFAAAGLWLLAACGTTAAVPPQVRLVDLRLLESSAFEQRFEVDLRIGNPNDVDLPLDGLTFDLEVNGETFASGFSDQRVTIPRLSEEVVSVSASTTLLAMVRQMLLLAERGEVAYRLRGLAYLDGLQRRSLPYESDGSFSLRPGSGPERSIRHLSPPG
jgi:LEA14-like dessication related protein